MPVVMQPRLIIHLLPLEPQRIPRHRAPDAAEARSITSLVSPQALYAASHTTSPASSVIINGVPIWSQ